MDRSIKGVAGLSPVKLSHEPARERLCLSLLRSYPPPPPHLPPPPGAGGGPAAPTTPAQAGRWPQLPLRPRRCRRCRRGGSGHLERAMGAGTNLFCGRRPDGSVNYGDTASRCPRQQSSGRTGGGHKMGFVEPDFSSASLNFSPSNDAAIEWAEATPPYHPFECLVRSALETVAAMVRGSSCRQPAHRKSMSSNSSPRPQHKTLRTATAGSHEHSVVRTLV